MLARAIRLAYDPYARPLFTGRRRRGRGLRRSCPVRLRFRLRPTPRGARYRTDGAVHATAWIAGWPRSDVGVSFLAPLLMHTTTLRTVSVTMEPVPPSRAFREAEAARTADAADDELRRRHGFLPTAQETQGGRVGGAPGAGAGRRPRFDPVRRLCDRVRTRREISSSARSSRSPTPPSSRASSCSGCTASRTPHSRTRCRSAGGSDDARGASRGRHGHRATTAHVQAAYPFVAEGGLGGRGVYIGRDAYGGSFCYDPFELYGRELTSPTCSSPASSAGPSRRS